MSGGIAGLVLAGGRGRRLGDRDKAFVELGGRPLLAHVFDRLAPQCAAMLISANGDPARFAAWATPVVADARPGSLGPLAGLLAGLDWLAEARPAFSALVSVSVDTPFLPLDLVTRLAQGWSDRGAEVASAVSAGRRHPVVALWPVGMREAVRLALDGGGGRSVDRVLQAHRCADVTWPSEPLDPFFNINHSHDLEQAQLLLGRIVPGG